MIEQTVRLRAVTNGIAPVLRMVEGDTGRVLKMYPDDMAQWSQGMTAEVAVHRPDDSYYSIAGIVDINDKYVTANVTQALTRPGKVECQLKVTLGGDIVSTYTFYIMVQKSTTGIPVEQLGYDIYDLIDAADSLQPSTGSGITEEIKQALLQIAEKVAYIDADGQSYYDDLYNALYPTYTVTNNLTDVTNSNNATQVTDGDSYTATLEANSGLIISNLTITMGGVDITDRVFTAS